MWDGLKLGELSGILDFEDYIVSNILLPAGSLIAVLFCTWKKGWNFDNYMLEANTGKGIKVQKWMKNYMRFVLPIIIIAIWFVSLLGPFVSWL